MHEALRHRQAPPEFAEQRILGNEHVGETDTGVIGRHVEGPQILLDVHAFAVGRHKKAGDAVGVAVLARGAGEQRAMGGDVHAGRPHLPAVDRPAGHAVLRRALRAGFHMRGVGAVVGLGQAEGDAVFAGDAALDHRPLLGASVQVEHGHERKIADDRVLVLQIVVQAQALGGEVLADHRHPQVRAIFAAVLLGESEAVVAGLVGEVLDVAQQPLPFGSGQPAMLEIRARPFAAMIEEADVVVGLLERADLDVDEGVELPEIFGQAARKVEVHVLVRWQGYSSAVPLPSALAGRRLPTAARYAE